MTDLAYDVNNPHGAGPAGPQLGVGNTIPPALESSVKLASARVLRARTAALHASDALIDAVWAHAKKTNNKDLMAGLRDDPGSTIRVSDVGGVTLDRDLLTAAPGLVSLHQAADAATKELRMAEDEQNQAMTAVGDAFAGSGVKVGRAPLGLTSAGIRQLNQAALAGQSLRLGATSFSSMSPSTISPASQPAYEAGVASFMRERTRVADLIPQQFTDRAHVIYYRLNSPADQAAAVAPGGEKPQSDPQIEAVTADIVKVAHWGKLQDEVVKDYAAWESVIGGEFIKGLIQEENRQLLVADGSGEDMVGLLETPSILEVHRDTTNERRFSAILRAITAVRTGSSFIEPDAVILNPTDWLDARIEESTSGGYLVQGPLAPNPNSVWGIPVYVTTDIPEGTGLVGNLAAAAVVHWREAPSFMVNQWGGEEEWKTNLTLVRAEERLVLAVVRPTALCAIRFD